MDSIATRQSLLERLQGPASHGSWQADWEALYGQYHQILLGFARRQGLSEVQADDVVQETMVTVARELSEGFHYDPRAGRFRSWLFTIARNKIRKFRRDRDGQHESADRESHEGGQSMLDGVADERGNDAEERDLHDWRLSVLEHLCDKIRQRFGADNFAIFKALIQEERAPEDVARAFGKSRGAVDVIKHRVFKALKQSAVELRFETAWAAEAFGDFP